MSASILVLDLIRAHYRQDEQAFRAFSLRLARLTKTESVRNTMLDVVQKGRASSRASTNGRPLASQPRAVSSELLERLPEVNFDDLLLEDSTRDHLEEVVLELAHRSELEERRLRPRSRLLFEGPPGNGKSSSAAAIGEEIGAPAYGVSIPQLVSKYIGDTEKNLGALFQCIHSGVIVVFDELDAIGSSRMRVDQAASASHNSIVNTLLTLLDRRTGGIIVATTNRADILDPALLRRFDEVVAFPAPTPPQLDLLARRLEEKFGLETAVDVSACSNFDAVTKAVLREARRAVMAEILARKAEESEDLPDEDREAEGA